MKTGRRNYRRLISGKAGRMYFRSIAIMSRYIYARSSIATSGNSVGAERSSTFKYPPHALQN